MHVLMNRYMNSKLINKFHYLQLNVIYFLITAKWHRTCFLSDQIRLCQYYIYIYIHFVRIIKNFGMSLSDKCNQCIYETLYCPN